ncbi:hypothetical protein ACLOJK_007767 [Asimina triloba]
MGDMEPALSQTPNVTDYHSMNYALANSAAIPGGHAYATNVDSASSIEPLSTDGALPDSSRLHDVNAHNPDHNPAANEALSGSAAVDVNQVDGVAVANKNSNSVGDVSQGVAMKYSTLGTGFDSINGNGNVEGKNFVSAGNAENGSVSNEIEGAIVEQQFAEGPAISTEEDRLWSIVGVNSLDFNAWTALIQETEKVAEWATDSEYQGNDVSLDNILKIRKVYDAFAAEFPLCYGYWKKYADHEARLGTVDKVVEVYERAVQAVTYSVEMWLHYCAFAISTYGDPDTVRRLFERGLAYVGTDYLSWPLWDKYIEYEYSLQDFKELAASRPLMELQTAEEAAAAAASLEANVQEDKCEVQPDSEEKLPKPVSAGLTEAEELEKYVAIREEMYRRAKEYDSKIIDFETAIRRPYFHVKPLDDAQLTNWHNYLDFVEGGGDFSKVVKLYERCLVACANYPEYWIRYVLCMEASGSMELANNALARATQVFVKRQPEIHIFAARFKEQNGDIGGARAEYQMLSSELSPGLLEAVIRHANMEYRLGNMESAFSAYDEAIAVERGKEHSLVLPKLLIQYSRFLYLVAGNVEKSREVLTGAFEHVQLSKPLLEAVIHLESIQSLPKRIDYLDSLVEKFITPNDDDTNMASFTEREDTSSIFLEFLDLFGDAQSLKKAENRHAKLFLHQKSTSESRKRQAEDCLASDRSKLAKMYAGVPNQSVVGTYPNGLNQWGVAYGQQPQAWPQATQTQGQQWNPGYQQAGYSGYAAYSSYPQVPTTSPQPAAYGAYPQVYPAVQSTLLSELRSDMEV